MSTNPHFNYYYKSRVLFSARGNFLLGLYMSKNVQINYVFFIYKHLIFLHCVLENVYMLPYLIS